MIGLAAEPARAGLGDCAQLTAPAGTNRISNTLGEPASFSENHACRPERHKTRSTSEAAGELRPAFVLPVDPTPHSASNSSVEAKPSIDIDEADTFAIVANDGTVGNASIRLNKIARSENSTAVVETAAQNLRQFGTSMGVTGQPATWADSQQEHRHRRPVWKPHPAPPHTEPYPMPARDFAAAESSGPTDASRQVRTPQALGTHQIRSGVSGAVEKLRCVARLSHRSCQRRWQRVGTQRDRFNLLEEDAAKRLQASKPCATGGALLQVDRDKQSLRFV